MGRIIFFILLFPVLAYAEETAKPEKLTVILDWYINPDHAPLVVAKEKGFFKAAGLDVELIGPADPADPPKWIAAGKADIGITYEPEFMMQVDRGLPLISIGSLIDKPLNCLAALKDSPIRSLADLKGKRIATSNSGLSSIMLNVMLEKQGLSSDDVEMVQVRYNLSQALLSHGVDAVNGMMRNIEVPALEASDHRTITFFPEEYGIPNYSELIFIIHSHHTKDARFPRFLAALEKAVAWLDAHPEEGWKLFAERYPEANNPVNKDAWFATLPYFAEEPGNPELTDWKTFAQFMYQHQLIRKVQPVSRYVY